MVAAAPAGGYSGKALPAKLGLRQGHRLLVVDPPPHLDTLLAGAPDGIVHLARLAPFDVGWVFVGNSPALGPALARLLPKLADAGMVWVSWPKRASGVATDMTEDRVREAALPLGLVDVKVCAVDATWSALKLVRRRPPRGG
jgi:hypothetical protein